MPEHDGLPASLLYIHCLSWYTAVMALKSTYVTVILLRETMNFLLQLLTRDKPAVLQA